MAAEKCISAVKPPRKSQNIPFKLERMSARIVLARTDPSLVAAL